MDFFWLEFQESIFLILFVDTVRTYYKYCSYLGCNNNCDQFRTNSNFQFFVAQKLLFQIYVFVDFCVFFFTKVVAQWFSIALFWHLLELFTALWEQWKFWALNLGRLLFRAQRFSKFTATFFIEYHTLLLETPMKAPYSFGRLLF